MKHLALYRKWRPQRFDEVVGQEHISRTLLNAIRHDRLSHAYLFCGPRGTGKTTSARLLAKALNCSDRQNGEPCNQCQNCQEITAGHSLDVVEIDAASNRGIDSARELREQVRFASTSGQYRVFIIDEFHMLTKEAFNALLKTLEEPPDNVIFVLATTEPHEVLATIVSRCQRFDFQRIATRALAGHLQKIALAEEIGVSQAAIDAMSRKANGGLRDGISLLDQVQALADPGEQLPDNLVYQSLGLVQEDEILAILNAAFTAQLEPMLQTLRKLLEDGHDALQIVQELIQLLRHLSLSRLPSAQLEILGVPAHLIDPVREMGARVSRGAIVSTIDILLRTSDRLHHCPQPDIWLEADLICLCLQAEKSLLQRLETVEKQLKSGPISETRAATTKPSQQKPTAQPTTQPKSSSATNFRSEAKTPTPATPPPAPLTHAPTHKPNPEIKPEPMVSGPIEGNKETLWRTFLGRVREEQPMMFGFLSNGKLVTISSEAQIWVIEFSQGSKALLQRLQQRLKGGDLQALVSEVMNAPYDIETRLESQEKKNRLTAESETKTLPEPILKPIPEPPKPPKKPAATLPERPVNAARTRQVTPIDDPEPVEMFDDEMVDMEYLPEPSETPPPKSESTPSTPANELQSIPQKSVSAPLKAPLKPATPELNATPEPPNIDLVETPPAETGLIEEIAEMFKGKIVLLEQ